MNAIVSKISGKEYNMKELKIASTDGKNKLHVYCWEPSVSPVAILQISHGMVEHLGRYDEFARFMADRGVIVIGNDHLGHGLTAKEGDHGFFGAEKSKTVVDDLYEVTKYAKTTYGGNLPYFLFGHSMGSFMARRYIMTYGGELTGVIISGTGSQPAAALFGGKLIANITGLLKGERHKPKLIKQIAFGSYLKRIENPKSKSDWLSKDEEIVKKYDSDKFCTFDFTVDGYKTLFDSISFIQKKENIEKIPNNLPILFISGTEDPVGNYGKDVESVYDTYDKAGVNDIEMLLYHDGRHEMLNEIEREGVFEDVYEWVENHIK